MDHTSLTKKETELFQAAKEVVSYNEINFDEMFQGLEDKYKSSGDKCYKVAITVNIDDETTEVFQFLFNKPNPYSYDRYVKTMSKSVTNASRIFVLDNIVPELREYVTNTLDEYPAMTISMTEKLLNMLGLGDATIKKL